MKKIFNRRQFLANSAYAGMALGMSSLPNLSSFASISQQNQKRIGIIGLDTSHSGAFARSINSNPDEYRGYKIVAAYPYGTKTIPSSTDRIPKFTEQIQKHGVKIVGSIKELLQQVDYVLLETNDGRLHLEQAKEVFEAKKPVFIDKPIAASYKDAQEIFRLSEKHGVPMFSASSLRYIPGMDEILDGKYGKVLGADVYTPAVLEASHPDFFWYGIHGVEMLFTALGTGCKTISRTHTKDTDVIVGTWEDGRIGTVRGVRAGKTGYGGTVYCEKSIVTLGTLKGYDPLLKKIVEFFDTGKAPFDPKETLEIAAFIEAADESKAGNGKVVDIKL